MSSVSHDTLPTQADLLPAGKLPLELLAELLAGLPTASPQLLLGPAAGEDAAVIDFAPGGERVLVAKSDPITFATDEIGYYAVNICVNDLAVTGATPRFYLPTLLAACGRRGRGAGAAHLSADRRQRAQRWTSSSRAGTAKSRMR